MLALRCHRKGPLSGLSLDSIDEPSPGPGDVLVRVQWASVNPIDWKLATASLEAPARGSHPWGVGSDFAGEVIASGCVRKGPGVGDRVFGCLDPMTSRQGTFAELIAVPADSAFSLPDDVPPRDAAAMSCAGFSALSMCDLGRVGDRSRVLINGAAGGVGHLALQLARIRGASVSAVASTGRRDFLHGLGADEFIDYSLSPPRDWPGTFDAILDCVPNLPDPAMARLLRPDGRYVRSTALDTLETTDDRNGICKRGLTLIPTEAAARTLIDGYRSDRLRIAIESEYPLAEAISALERSMMGRVQGKLLVRIP